MLSDYLQDQAFGLGCNTDEVDETYTIAAANVCDEFVTVSDYSTTIDSVSVSGDTLTLDADRLFYQRGDKVNLSSATGKIPEPLLPSTDYYVIPYQRKDTVRLKLAATYEDAMSGTAINITTDGSEGRTNYALQSQTFDNATWTKTRATVTANATTAPDGTSTADRLVSDATAAATHWINQIVTTVNSDVQSTFSVYLKIDSHTYAHIYIRNSVTTADYVRGIFEISSGAVMSSGNGGTGSGATATIQSIGSGWYRCTVTGVPSTAVNTTKIEIYPSDSSSVASFNGDSTTGVYMWGSQLEKYSSATAYIETTTAVTVTGSSNIVKVGEPRYAGGIVIESENSHDENIKDILAGMIGFNTCSGGVHKMVAGA